MTGDINHLVVDKLFIIPIATCHFSNEGLEPDPYRSKRSIAWVAVLGTAAAVACVGLVAYILKKKRNGFSHRKLVEEYPSDPGMLSPTVLYLNRFPGLWPPEWEIQMQ